MKKEKTPKKKPSHSVASNIVWSVRKLLHYAPAAFVIFALYIPVHIASRYLGIVFPARVLEEVTAGNPWAQAVVPVGRLLLFMLLADLSSRVLEIISRDAAGRYRYKVTDLWVRKTLSLFYEDYEKKPVRDLAERASEATQQSDGDQPLTDMVRGAFSMTENVIGYLLFGTVISFASPWLVPILTLSPVANWLAGRAYNRWDHAHRKKLSDLETKQACVRKLPDDFKSAKDIRIYSMAGWIRDIYRDLTGQLVMENRKKVSRRFLSRTADLFVILLRDGGAYLLLISMFLRGEIDAAQFVLYFAAVSSFAEWIGGIVDAWNTLHASSMRVCDFRE